MLRSIKRQRKILLAGTTLHMNDNLPISESTWCLVRLCFSDAVNECSSSKMDNFLSTEIMAVTVIATISMLKNIIRGDGLTTFSGLISTLILLQTCITQSKFHWHSDKPAGPGCKKVIKIV